MLLSNNVLLECKKVKYTVQFSGRGIAHNLLINIKLTMEGYTSA